MARSASSSPAPRTRRATPWHPGRAAPGRAPARRRPPKRARFALRRQAGRLPRKASAAPARRRSATRTARAGQGTVRALPRPRPGLVAHTEFASEDPAATQRFFSAAFGWRFRSYDRPDGPYLLFKGPQRSGGGVRRTEAGEHPHAIPYVEAADLEEARRIVEKAGGRVLVPRLDLAEAQGSYFLCEAPGGVVVGVWAAK